jgi:hypothetical protein
MGSVQSLAVTVCEWVFWLPSQDWAGCRKCKRAYAVLVKKLEQLTHGGLLLGE